MKTLVNFMWDRLDLASTADIEGRKPCLQEDWFVEDAIKLGSPFVWRDCGADLSHRLLFRFARARAWGRGEYGGHPQWLLLHQMVELLPFLVGKANLIWDKQRAKKGGAA